MITSPKAVRTSLSFQYLKQSIAALQGILTLAINVPAGM
jgi:hypothetical protein